MQKSNWSVFDLYLHNGAVILLHATSKDNMNILDEVIKEIKNMGYEFRSLNTFKK